MRRPLIRCIVALALASLAATGTIAFAHGGPRPAKARDADVALIGQVINSPSGVTPATSIQFGNVSQVGDRPTDQLTFFTDTTTQGVVANGPLRIISRTGRFTIYHDASANGDFANPDSFRDGTPVLTAVLRQQVIVNTATSSFTTLNVNTITALSAFELGNQRIVLGRVGGRFRTVLSGQVATAAPPAAYMAGYTFAGR